MEPHTATSSDHPIHRSVMYCDISKYVCTLGVTLVVTDFGQLVSNAAVSRLSKSDSSVIGTFTAVYFVQLLLTSFTKIFKLVVLAVPKTQEDFLKIMQFFVYVNVILLLLSAVCALTPLGGIVTGIEENEAGDLKTAFLSMSMLPPLDGLRFVLQGTLCRERLAVAQTVAALSGFAVQLGLTLGAVYSKQDQATGTSTIIMSAVTVYSAILVQIFVMAIAWKCHSRVIYPSQMSFDAPGEQTIQTSTGTEHAEKSLLLHGTKQYSARAPVKSTIPQTRDSSPSTKVDGVLEGLIRRQAAAMVTVKQGLPRSKKSAQDAASSVQICDLIKFAGPLSLTEIVQRISRPVINAVCAFTGGTEAVAILGLVYPLGHLSYGWINTIKSAESAFRKTGFPAIQVYAKLKTFAFWCIVAGVGSCWLFVYAGFFDFVLRDLQDVDSSLANKCRIPLLLFSVFAIPVGVRGVLTGHLVAEKATQPLIWGGPARLVTIIILLFTLPKLGIKGGVLGVGSLMGGFYVETSATLLALRFASTSLPPRQLDSIKGGERVMEF